MLCASHESVTFILYFEGLNNDVEMEKSQGSVVRMLWEKQSSPPLCSTSWRRKKKIQRTKVVQPKKRESIVSQTLIVNQKYRFTTLSRKIKA